MIEFLLGWMCGLLTVIFIVVVSEAVSRIKFLLGWMCGLLMVIFIVVVSEGVSRIKPPILHWDPWYGWREIKKRDQEKVDAIDRNRSR